MIIFVNVVINVSLLARDESLYCSMDMTSDWHELDTTQRFSSKWVMAGTLSIKKRMEHTLRIESMTLAWHGPAIERLEGSLFKMPRGKKEIFAIDENLISKGIWSIKFQRMHLHFSVPEYIHDPVALYGLVFTFDTQTEDLLKQGYFEIVPDLLPEPLQKSMKNAPIKLAFIKR